MTDDADRWSAESLLCRGEDINPFVLTLDHPAICLLATEKAANKFIWHTDAPYRSHRGNEGDVGRELQRQSPQLTPEVAVALLRTQQRMLGCATYKLQTRVSALTVSLQLSVSYPLRLLL